MRSSIQTQVTRAATSGRRIAVSGLTKPIETCQCQTRRLSFHLGKRRIIVIPTRDDWPQIRNEWRKGYRQDPIGVTAAALLAGGLAAFTAWWFYDEYKRYKPYPAPVAKKLQQAMAYGHVWGQPVESLEAFKEALAAADEEGMDKFSDEVLGIKIQMSQLMEKYQEYVQTITAMEVVMRDCLAEANRCRSDPAQKKKRTRLLRWSVEMGVKLGELYSRPEVWDRDAAEERLSWAVETMIKEGRRRDEKHISDDDEGKWFTRDELAATIEGLAHTYEKKNQFYLAAPLFLHAINLQEQKSCHTVILMNNLATSLSQQSPRAAAAVQQAANAQAIQHSSPPPVSRAMLLEMAQTWAKQALEVSSSIKPPDRDEECDIGCVVATHNLGELAEMLKNTDEAKKRYHEAISLARAIGYQEGVEQSSSRLRRLESKT